MKNIFKIIFVLFGFFFIPSCEETSEKTQTKANGFALRFVTNTPSLVLNPINDSDTAVVIEWDRSDNGVSSEESNYQVEVAQSGTNFASPILANLGSVVSIINNIRSYTFKVKEINLLANKLPNYVCGQEMSIDIRIKSKLGDFDSTAFVQYSSNSVTVKVSPYSSASPILSFATSTTNAASSNKLASLSIYDATQIYEAYVYLQPGSYKFYKPNACGDFTSATSFGGVSGTLDSAAAAPSIVVASAGHYLVKANLLNNTYTISEFTSIGVFGRATRGGVFGFNNVVPMVYDVTTKKWTLTMDLLKGQPFKFRALKWSGNLIVPPASAAFPKPDYIPSGSTSISTFGSPSVNSLSESSTTDIRTTGTTSLIDTDKYLVEVDISNPRIYTYKLTKI